MPAAEELRRERNRLGQERYQQRYFGAHPTLSRVRADIRLEARAVLERQAALNNLTITMTIEKLALDADRRTTKRLTGEALARYTAAVVPVRRSRELESG
jgi:hypothetical protein